MGEIFLGTNLILKYIEGISANLTIGIFDNPNFHNNNTDESSVIVDWGDGSDTIFLSSDNIIEESNLFTISHAHTYSNVGTYEIIIEVKDGNGYIGYITSQAIVEDAMISPSSNSIILNNNPIVNCPIVAFNDDNPISTINDFMCTIDWGDDSPFSYCTISQPDGIGTSFIVSGRHNYLRSGTYNIIANIESIHTSKLIMNNSITTYYGAFIGPLNINIFNYKFRLQNNKKSNKKSHHHNKHKHKYKHKIYNHNHNNHNKHNKHNNNKYIKICTFIDESNGNVNSKYFSFEIDWGDKNKNNVGFIKQNLEGTSQYTLYSKHKYKNKGDYNIELTIIDNAGQYPLIVKSNSNINIY